jgi:hypothetical protein
MRNKWNQVLGIKVKSRRKNCSTQLMFGLANPNSVKVMHGFSFC